MPFIFKRLEIPDVLLIEPLIFKDARGMFAEIYKFSDFSQYGITNQITQINYSKSNKHVLRGLHYQKKPLSEGKLIRVISGEVFDVAVDIRKGSPYYGKWVSEILSSENMKMLYIPDGFAHGFCVLSYIAEITYNCTNTYSPENEGGIIWNDPELNIKWPVSNPVLSEKDSRHPLFKYADNNFEFYKNK